MDSGCSWDGFGMPLGLIQRAVGSCGWSRDGVTVGIVVVAVVAARIRSAYRCTPGAYRCVQMATGVFQVSRWHLRTDIQGTPGLGQAPEAEPGFWGALPTGTKAQVGLKGSLAPSPQLTCLR